MILEKDLFFILHCHWLLLGNKFFIYNIQPITNILILESKQKIMQKVCALLENKYSLAILMLASVYSIYRFGKMIGELAYYVSH